MAGTQSLGKRPLSVRLPSLKAVLALMNRHDVTVTHNDLDYMKKHYETSYRPELNAKSTGKDDDKAFDFAEKRFRPLYYIKEYEQDRAKIEMSFDLTQYVAKIFLRDNESLTLQLSAAIQRRATRGTSWSKW